MADDLLTLASRVESAEGAVPELRGAIAVAAGQANKVHPTNPERCAWGDDSLYTAAPCYDTSLDAAMTLVPDGWRVVGIAESEPDSPPEELSSRPWAVQLKLPSDDLRAKWASAYAATPALAFTAACLKARAA